MSTVLTRSTLFAMLLVGLGVRADDKIPPDPNAVRTAAANAEKAEWDARKARLDYENAAGPASGLTGAVKTEAGAGTMESELLMAQALEPIAKEIVIGITARSRPKIDASSSIVVFAGNDGVDLSRWELFDFRTDRIREQFEAIDAPAGQLDKDYDAIGKVRKETEAESNKRSVAAVTAGVQALSKLFSYAQSDYTAAGIAIAEDNDLLASAVASQRGDLRLLMPSLLAKRGAAKDLFVKIQDLEERAEERRAWTALATSRIADLKARIAKKPANEKALQELLDRYEPVVALAIQVATSYTALLTTLSSTAADNPMPLGAVVKEKAISDALGTNGYGLFLVMSAASGGMYTKKNLWTAFGAMPFFASGGAVAHYKVISRADGLVVAAGVVSFACAYRKVSSVADSTVRASCTVD